MLAVGEHLLGHVDDQTLKMTTGFSGGVGLTHKDMCGLLSSGIMLIGALHGRTRPNVDDTPCQNLVTEYRNRFEQQFGSVYCHQLRAGKFGSQGQEPCSVLAERAALILLNLLANDAGQGGNRS